MTTRSKAVPSLSADDPKTRKQKEIEATENLEARSQDLLNNVDDSYLMKESKRREYPTFDRSEVKIGPILGVGGFGVVYEVKDFSLAVEYRDHIDEVIVTNDANSSDNDAASALSDIADSEKGDHLVSLSTSNRTKGRHSAVSSPPSDEKHYDVRFAREQMSKFVRRNGDARYAIKKLHRDLNDLERARGRLDLALEAKFLSVIWHPNIGTYVVQLVGHLSSLGQHHSHILTWTSENARVAYKLSSRRWVFHHNGQTLRNSGGTI